MKYDVIIVGSGIVGATVAIALAKKSSLNIAILDSQAPSVWQRDKYHYRMSAISLASQRIFHYLNVWETMREKRISPFKHMHVWHGDDSNQINSKIDFDCADVSEPVLGYIIEDNVMRTSLHEAFPHYPNIHLHVPVQLKSLEMQTDYIELQTEDNKTFSAKLLIAADGANSWVRTQANVDLHTFPYDHTAMVATVNTELSHQQTAWQKFLPTGPLAFLPLDDAHLCSIVWSTSQPEKLLSLNDEEFCRELESAMGYKLGKILHTEKRYSFDLHMRHVKNYVKPRIALIGDAAHTLHPLAGQGVNLGISDAICLADIVMQAERKNRDYASFHTLRRYERWRKGDNLVMLKTVGLLKNLFMSENRIVQNVRDMGLIMTDRMTFLKNFFIHYALGNEIELPYTSSSF